MHQPFAFPVRTRRTALKLFVPAILMACGCTESVFRGQSEDAERAVEVQEKEATTIRDVALPYGLQPRPVEAIGLVTGLQGTGSDPSPGELREVLISEMQKRGVSNPNQVLGSSATTLVMVRGFLRPGAVEGDRFDLEVRVPADSESTSLRGGFLLPVNLREFRMLGGAFREGETLGTGTGAVMVDADTDSGPEARLVRGRILGGGIVKKTQPLALVLRPGSQSTLISQRVGQAIDRRFSYHRQGVREGVATPKTDKFIELALHPRYKHNVERYLQVIGAIALRESPLDRAERLKALGQELQEPATSSKAALRLEAIGNEATDTLKQAVAHPNPEVRFHAAEALAYLGHNDAVAPLTEIARNERAFRVFALTALATMNDNLTAYDSLMQLLEVASAETRYGAFRALWTMNPDAPPARGEILGGQFSYHVLRVGGPEMVHVTRSFRPEIVLFGAEQTIRTPFVLEAGPRIMVHSDGGDQVTVILMAVNQPEQRRTVSNKLDEVIRAVVDVGGSYPDVVSMLRLADERGMLNGRIAIDALPEAGRSYQRMSNEEFEDPRVPESASAANLEDIEPVPDHVPTWTERWFGWMSDYGPAK